MASSRFLFLVGKNVYLKISNLQISHRDISQKYLFEHIKILQCYALTRRLNHLALMLASPLTYAVYHWPVYCKCAMVQKQCQIFNYLHFKDTWTEGGRTTDLNIWSSSTKLKVNLRTKMEIFQKSCLTPLGSSYMFAIRYPVFSFLALHLSVNY